MTNLEVIHELYRCFRTQDYEGFLQICSPDLEWIQNPGFPGGSTWQGAQTVVDCVFKTFYRDWASWSFEIVQYLDAGETIIVIGTYTGTHGTSGQSFRADTAHVYDLQAGKIIRFRQFTDTKMIWDAIERPFPS